jgi:hypothetical protein
MSSWIIIHISNRQRAIGIFFRTLIFGTPPFSCLKKRHWIKNLPTKNQELHKEPVTQCVDGKWKREQVAAEDPFICCFCSRLLLFGGLDILPAGCTTSVVSIRKQREKFLRFIQTKLNRCISQYEPKEKRRVIRSFNQSQAAIYVFSTNHRRTRGLPDHYFRERSKAKKKKKQEQKEKA